MQSSVSTNNLVVDCINRALVNAPDKVYFLGENPITYAMLAGNIADISPYFEDVQRAAIWMPKGSGYATVILATLANGKTYVPMDGNQPASRAKLILNNSQCEILFTSTQHYFALCVAGIPSTLKRVVIVDCAKDEALIDAVQFNFRHQKSYQPLPELSLNSGMDAIATILYTSGSTGTPKGVQLTYRNLENFIAWSYRELSLESKDSLLNTANFNFDLSTFDLFLSLRITGSLYITCDHEQNNLARLSAILAEYDITCIYAVPTLFTLMNRVDIWSRKGVKSIKTIIFAGEVMPIKQLRHMVLNLGGNVRYYNFYGPTETNVCTYYQLMEGDIDRETPLPIGKPIDGAVVELRSDTGIAISKESDEIGEIWVFGDCVTPGYLSCIVDKNAINHQQGWHATGDLGSYHAGNLIYRGRIDRMVKINGYRVELGEIEAALLQHNDITEAAVVVTSSPEKQIKAHVVIKQDAESTCSELSLKQYCATKLPRYMVPHKFASKLSLGKNENGKVDYKALLAEA